jgi:biopolymer transport protein ExbD
MLIDRQTRDDTVELRTAPIFGAAFGLLAFVLIGAWYADAGSRAPAGPPAPAHVRPVTAVPRELVVDIAADGRLLVFQVEYTPADLERLIARAVRENPDQGVVIRGDPSAGLQVPGRVLSLCEKYGVKRKYLAALDSAAKP